MHKSNVAASKLLSQIDHDIHQQSEFLKNQNSLLQKSCMDFRKVLSRIFFLQFVAQTFNIDYSKEIAKYADSEKALNENLLLGDGEKKKQELSENILGTQTSLRIVGGTVKSTELLQLKKLIFRGTRGKALVQTFELNLDDSDVLNNPSWSFDQMEGYLVIFDDSTNIYRSIMRICNSFGTEVYETSISQITTQLHDVLEQKSKIKELISRSRKEFVDYLTTYNPLKDADDVSLVMVYKQFLMKDQIIYRTLN